MKQLLNGLWRNCNQYLPHTYMLIFEMQVPKVIVIVTLVSIRCRDHRVIILNRGSMPRKRTGRK